MKRGKDKKSHEKIYPTSRSSFRIIVAWVVTVLAVILLNVVSSIQITRGMIELRKQELRRLVTLGLNSVEPIRRDYREGLLARDDALTAVRDTIRLLIFDDPETRNYLFMSAYDGTMLVQPFEPEKEGTDQWNLKDSRGTYIIRELAGQAQEGGGFVEYYYPPPDREDPEYKISYVVGIDELSCYVGAGLYLQDIKALLRGVFWKNHLAILLIFIFLGLLIMLIFRPYISTYKTLLRQFNIVTNQPDMDVIEKGYQFHPDSEAGVLMHNFYAMLEELKNSRSKLQQSLDDKKVLLQEIHHRVKNNLQIVSSLLNLQMSALKDPEHRRLFHESALRVQSMALIHETIYASHVYDGVEMSEHIRRVTGSILRSLVSPDVSIQQEYDLQKGYLSIDKAILCGLILTELITNAIKHGFSGRSEGVVRVVYHQNEKDAFLSVADNGNGAPPDILTRESESLGVSLIKSLTGQLEGIIQLDVTGGCGVSIRFPLEK